jgi:hypothetical protein
MTEQPCSTDVFKRCYSRKMIGVDAELVAACVVDLEAVRDRPDVELIEDPVRALEASLVPDLAIAIE